MSPILLTPNSKPGIFGTFPKERRKLSLSNGNSRSPVIKVTTKVNLHEGNQPGLPHAALYTVNSKATTFEFCTVDKNESVSATFLQ